MYILGGLDDQIPLIVWGQISNSPFLLDNTILQNFGPYKALFYGMMYPLETTRPIFVFIVSLLLSIFGPNILIFLNISSFIALFILSYYLFKKYKFGIIFALIFTFSSFMWSHLGIHLSLMSVWVFPAFFLLLKKYEGKGFNVRSAAIIGVFISVVALISNYFGFFILVFFSIYTLISFLYRFRENKSLSYERIKFFVFSVFVSTVVIVVVLFPSVKEQFFSTAELRKIGGSYTLTRSYEDFFTFSSRPWYYILPPVKNPIFGDFSKLVLERVESTGYFLADDYFAVEHQGNYFGTVLLITTLIVFLYVLIKGDDKTREKVMILGLTAFVIFLFTFPPFFTISGVNIWTPGTLMYKFFPAFRVTSRLSVIILMCILLILAIGIDFVYKTAKKDKKYLKYFMVMLLVVTLAETYVPVKILTLSNPPEIYKFIRDNTPVGSKFAVYPYDKTDDALLWLPVHERLLINPRSRLVPGFDSRKFTEDLNTTEGLNRLVDMGAEYLVVYRGENAKEFELKSEPRLITKISIGAYDLYAIK